MVVWTPEAEQDRLDIWDYVASDDPVAAAEMDARFCRAAEHLADFPLLGHIGLQPGTRELLPHENYRLVYHVKKDAVWILALVHTARQWPPVVGG